MVVLVFIRFEVKTEAVKGRIGNPPIRTLQDKLVKMGVMVDVVLLFMSIELLIHRLLTNNKWYFEVCLL